MDEEKDVYIIDKGSSTEIKTFETKEAVLKTKSVTLDTLFENKQKNNIVIKIDVEGAEFDVLKGAKKWLAETDGYWVIEYHGNTRDKLINVMKEYGYKIEKEFDNKKIIFKK